MTPPSKSDRDGDAYCAHPPTPDEFSIEGGDPMAWEAEGWDEGVVAVTHPSQHLANGDLESRAEELRPRCCDAIDRGECTRTPCDSKDAVLALIKSGEADMMVLRDPGPELWIGEGWTPPVEHFAIRFNDRALGDAARELTLDGFGLR